MEVSVQVKNVFGGGFACFFGDDKKNNLVMLNMEGKVLWQKLVKEQGCRILFALHL